MDYSYVTNSTAKVSVAIVSNRYRFYTPPSSGSTAADMTRYHRPSMSGRYPTIPKCLRSYLGYIQTFVSHSVPTQ